jgi:molybdopterin converting factor small subunit
LILSNPNILDFRLASWMNNTGSDTLVIDTDTLDIIPAIAGG